MPLELGLKSIGPSQAMIFVEIFLQLGTHFFFFKIKNFQFLV
jgi:hypothetical protein